MIFNFWPPLNFFPINLPWGCIFENGIKHGIKNANFPKKKEKNFCQYYRAEMSGIRRQFSKSNFEIQMKFFLNRQGGSNLLSLEPSVDTDSEMVYKPISKIPISCFILKKTLGENIFY